MIFKNVTNGILTLTLLVFFISCEPSGSGVQNNLNVEDFKKLNNQVDELNIEIAFLKNEVVKQKKQLETCNLSDEVDKINLKIESINNNHIEFYLDFFKNQLKKSLVFNVKDCNGFSTLDSSLGRLFISPKEVKSHLDGHKIILSVGNPYNAVLTNPKIKLRWNRPWKFEINELSFEKQYINWENSFKEKEFNLLKDFKAGSWTEVELFISPSDPRDLENVEISIDISTVRLSTN